MSDYLTPEIKSKILISLGHQIARGRVDPSFIPYLGKINNLEGLCTLSSCHGHYQGFEGERTEMNEGHIIFTFSKRIFDYLFFEDKVKIMVPYVKHIKFDYLYVHPLYDKDGNVIEQLTLPALRIDFINARWESVMDRLLELLNESILYMNIFEK